MAKKNNINAVKGIFREIEIIKQELRAKLREIDADDIHSGDYKMQLQNRARAEARERLDSIMSRADTVVNDLKADITNGLAFDYSNPKLISAVTFITNANGNIPEAAAKAIISDFKGRPAELSYVSSLFDKSGLKTYAIEAAEAAGESTIQTTMPDRLGDAIYYSLSADPEAKVDFSGFENELNGIMETSVE